LQLEGVRWSNKGEKLTRQLELFAGAI